MSTDIPLRAAVKDDSYDLAYLHALAGAGIIEYLYEDLVPGVGPIELFARFFAAGTVPYTFQNCVVAEDAGRVVGKIHTYPCDENAIMPHDPLIPDERLKVVDLLFEPAPRSWHIEAMAVLPEYRGQGLGSRFLDFAKSQARDQGFDELSLHVFEDNVSAIRLYDRHGFTVAARAPMVEQLAAHHDGGMLLMRCPLESPHGDG